MKVYVVLESFDNGAMWEENYQYHNKFVGCFSSMELAEKVAKKKAKEVYDNADNADEWYLLYLTNFEMTPDLMGVMFDGHQHRGYIKYNVSEVELDAEEI